MYDRTTRLELARGLAAAFLAGAWEQEALVARGLAALDAWPRWVVNVAAEVRTAYPVRPADRPRELAAYIELAIERRRPPSSGDPPPRVRHWHAFEPAMGRRRWPVVELASAGELAAFLELGDGELRWLADTRRAERRVPDEQLRNYRYAAVARRRGPPRVIERPKPRLKAVQRRVLREILDWIPAHDAAHGFTRGRSALTHARMHTGRHAVLGLDLEDFFCSVPAARVFGTFRAAGYPEQVAYLLTGLTTNSVPVDVWHAVGRPAGPELIDAHHRLGRRLAEPHLPQGAPTSPALANLACRRLDARLGGLAAAIGATYSRYADDLTFSGGARLVRQAAELRATVTAIAREEGFAVNRRKSTLVTRAGRQRVCGIVVNEHTNVSRAEYDVLKATLRNAVRQGGESQNRTGMPRFREHLLGRIAWVEQLDATRGARLRRTFARIPW